MSVQHSYLSFLVKLHTTPLSVYISDALSPYLTFPKGSGHCRKVTVRLYVFVTICLSRVQLKVVNRLTNIPGYVVVYGLARDILTPPNVQVIPSCGAWSCKLV